MRRGPTSRKVTGWLHSNNVNTISEETNNTGPDQLNCYGLGAGQPVINWFHAPNKCIEIVNSGREE